MKSFKTCHSVRKDFEVGYEHLYLFLASCFWLHFKFLAVLFNLTIKVTWYILTRSKQHCSRPVGLVCICMLHKFAPVILELHVCSGSWLISVRFFREEEAIQLDGLNAAQIKEIREKSEKHVFQAEVNRMMKLIINSLYKNKEVRQSYIAPYLFLLLSQGFG